MERKIDELAEKFADLVIDESFSANEMREMMVRHRIDLRGDAAFIFYRVMSNGGEEEDDEDEDGDVKMAFNF